MKTLLLANHAAAGGRAARLLPQVVDFLRTKLPDLEYVRATNAAEVRTLAAEAARAGYDRVLAAGGDGTAHAAANGLCGTETALGVIPLGHGNDLCRSLGIPLDPVAAADFLLRATAAPMDVVRVGEHIYAGVAGLGFDATTNRRANAWPGWPSGHLRYMAAGLWTLLTFEPMRVELVTDTENYSGEVMWVAVANTAFYGGGLRIAPRAVCDDGWLDICIVERISRRALFDLYPALHRGRHLSARCVRTFRATQVEVRAPAGAELFGDGELLDRAPFRLRVEAKALRVLRGPQSPGG